MTANVSIVVDHRDNVLRLPIDALRFVPPQSGRPLAEVAAATESAQRKIQVWIPGPAGRLWPVAVKLGIDNGSFAELLGGNLRPGDAVVTSLAGPGPRTPNQAVLALKH
jgi:HlyD family secretion protein